MHSQTVSLNQGWTLIDGENRYACEVPCSAYDTLLKNNAIPDPYWGENEWISTAVSDRDFVLETSFQLPEGFADVKHAALTFFGIDTLSEVYLNGKLLGHTDNMHRTWEYAVEGLLRQGGNLLRLELHSPTKYIARKYAERPLWGVEGTMPGYQHIRKAHCMFGWDWGPQLPDLGIWRDVTLTAWDGGRIHDALFTQEHAPGRVTLHCSAEVETWEEGLEAVCTVTGPDGRTWTAPLREGEADLLIEDPQLWWVRGLGEQPLYECRVELRRGGEVLDSRSRRIGLRTLTISQEPDEWGKEFCFINNGIKVFAMGANYIPEDQILPRCTQDAHGACWRTAWTPITTSSACGAAGLIRRTASMTSAMSTGSSSGRTSCLPAPPIRWTPEFEATVRAEIRDNALRLRNHPSLGLWCGNNEIESSFETWGLPEDPEAQAGLPEPV